jgi:gas vesicle protein
MLGLTQGDTMRFVIGFAAGFVLSLILAPTRGEVTRRRLAQKTRELMQAPKKKIKRAAEEAAEAAKERAGEIGAEVGRRAAESAVQAVENDLLGHDQTA